LHIKKNQWCLSKVNKLIKKDLERNINKKEQKNNGSQEKSITSKRKLQLKGVSLTSIP
jgi:hypothetical protein